MVDWETGRFNRDDLCYRFFLDMKTDRGQTRARTKCSSSTAAGTPTPMSASWKHAVSSGPATGGNSPGWRWEWTRWGTVGPNNRMIPLYWTEPLARDYVNRVLALGWIPSLTYGEPAWASGLRSSGLTRSATALPVAGRYQPDWKSDPQSAIESYLVRRHGDRGYLLSMISHEKKAEGGSHLPSI